MCGICCLYTAFVLIFKRIYNESIKSINEKYMIKERGNALIGIVVIIIVFLVGAIFFWNNYQIQLKKNEEIKKQASITQTIIVPPETSTSTATSTELNNSTSTATSTKAKVK